MARQRGLIQRWSLSIPLAHASEQSPQLGPMGPCRVVRTCKRKDQQEELPSLGEVPVTVGIPLTKRKPSTLPVALLFVIPRPRTQWRLIGVVCEELVIILHPIVITIVVVVVVVIVPTGPRHAGSALLKFEIVLM